MRADGFTYRALHTIPATVETPKLVNLIFSGRAGLGHFNRRGRFRPNIFSEAGYCKVIEQQRRNRDWGILRLDAAGLAMFNEIMPLKLDSLTDPQRLILRLIGNAKAFTADTRRSLDEIIGKEFPNDPSPHKNLRDAATQLTKFRTPLIASKEGNGGGVFLTDGGRALYSSFLTAA